MSRTLQSSEKNYTTTEKELLAILYCLEKARYIVLGTDLTILTDNHALVFLKTCRLLNTSGWHTEPSSRHTEPYTIGPTNGLDR